MASKIDVVVNGEKTMRMRWLLGTIAMGALTIPAFGQVDIYIGRTPPPLRYEVPPPIPGMDIYESTDIGATKVDGTCGFPDAGSGRLFPVRTGAIRIMTATDRVGSGMRAIGTMKIIETTMIMIATSC